MLARCIDAGNYRLTEGKIYNVKIDTIDINQEFYSVIDDLGDKQVCFRSRFELVTEQNQNKTNNKEETKMAIKQVVCVDATGRKNITEGVAYDVVNIPDELNYIIIDDNGKEHEYYKSRFQDIGTRIEDEDERADCEANDPFVYAPARRETIKQVKCVNAPGLKKLTEGKIYDVVEVLGDTDYIVIDDKGKEHEYYQRRFVDLTTVSNIPVPNTTGRFTLMIEGNVDDFAKIMEKLTK